MYATKVAVWVCVLVGYFGFCESGVQAICNLPQMDFNGDLHVDANDYDTFSACYNGPGNPIGPECFCVDSDGDNDVDPVDFDAFSACFNGPANPPSCMPAGMNPIQAGEFWMGDASINNEGQERERPRHLVYTDAFYMDRTEVTNQRYAEGLNWAINQNNLITVISGVVYKATDTNYSYCETTSSSSDSQITWNDQTNQFGVVPGKANYPMIEVTIRGAMAYANWRSAMEGRSSGYNLNSWQYNWDAGCGYRLPTEAEWERAARGGAEGRRFPWSDDNYNLYGNNIHHGLANYYNTGPYWQYTYDMLDPSNYDEYGYHPSFKNGTEGGTNPVQSFAPNNYGLYGMCGNVWEFCNDQYLENYYLDYNPNDPSTPWPNPRGPGGLAGVTRGGCYNSTPNLCRISCRSLGGGSSEITGFRLVLIDP